MLLAEKQKRCWIAWGWNINEHGHNGQVVPKTITRCIPMDDGSLSIISAPNS